MTSLEVAASQLKLYEAQATSGAQESRQNEHDAAMRCLEFEGQIAFGLSVLDFVHRLDEAWRTKVYKGLMEYDERVAKTIDDLYIAWLRTCTRVIGQLGALENEGIVVNGARQFRSACDEVQAILQDPVHTLASDRLVELRDQAIDEHRRGETVEMKELSD